MQKKIHLSRLSSCSSFLSLSGVEIIFSSHKLISTSFTSELILYDRNDVPLCTLTSPELIQYVKNWLDSH